LVMPVYALAINHFKMGGCTQNHRLPHRNTF